MSSNATSLMSLDDRQSIIIVLFSLSDGYRPCMMASIMRYDDQYLESGSVLHSNPVLETRNTSPTSIKCFAIDGASRVLMVAKRGQSLVRSNLSDATREECRPQPQPTSVHLSTISIFILRRRIHPVVICVCCLGPLWTFSSSLLYLAFL